VITALFCDVGINPQGAKTVDTSSDAVNGREVSELRQTKKAGTNFWSRFSVGWLPG
jgi:hypothetical protein